MKARSAGTHRPFQSRCSGVANDKYTNTSGMVPVSPAGTSYYEINASGASTMDIWMYVVAYAS
jgi:hypothetical protein